MLRSAVIVKPVDIEGTAIYAVELGLWIGIMALGVIFNLRQWLKRGTPASQSNEADDHPDDVRTAPTTGTCLTVDNARDLHPVASRRPSSVFETVGLRKRALQILRLRQRTPA